VRIVRPEQIFCPLCKLVVDRADLVRGYEAVKGDYVCVKGSSIAGGFIEKMTPARTRELAQYEHTRKGRTKAPTPWTVANW